MGISTSTGTLTAGQSRTFNLSPASAVTLTLSPNVRVTITETPAIVAATGLGGNASRVHEPRLPGVVTYGPYPMGGSVLVEVESNSGSSVSWVRSDSIVAESADGLSSLVNTAGNVFQTGSAPALKTLAEMLAYTPATDGAEVYVTDLPSGTRGRFYWHLASGKWRPAGMVLVDRSLTLDSGVNSTAEQYLKSLSIPAGLLFVGAEILFEYTLARSNATDAGGAGGCRIGNAGTISDANFGNGSGIVQLSSSSRTVGNSHRYRVVSATQIEKVGNPATAAASFTSGVTSSSPAPWNVGSTASRLYFSPTVQLAAATGTTLPQVGYCALWLLPS